MVNYDLGYAAQRIDDKPREIAPPRSSNLERFSPDAIAFDSASYPTMVFIVLLRGELDLEQTTLHQTISELIR